jgi:hypothetical protein
VILFILPLPFMYKLQMPRRKKIAVIGVFMLGLFTTIVTGLRMEQAHNVAFGNGNSTMLVVWSNVEMNVGVRCLFLPSTHVSHLEDTKLTSRNQIILTCIPVLAPLFKFFSQQLSTAGYKSHEDSHQMNTFSKKAQKSSGTSHNKNTHSVAGNESQETILNDGTYSKTDSFTGKGDILKTVQIDVQSVGAEELGYPNGKTFYDAR